MNEPPQERALVATLVPCEQFSYRVRLPDRISIADQDEIFRQAQLKANRDYFDCARAYQQVAWAGNCNLAFMDSLAAPRDSKSNLIHFLLTLNVIKASRARLPQGAAGEVRVETKLPKPLRPKLSSFCQQEGILWSPIEPPADRPYPKFRKGGEFRAQQHATGNFSGLLAKTIEDAAATVSRTLTGIGFVKDFTAWLVGVGALCVWPFHIGKRTVFSLRYRKRAAQTLAKLDGAHNTFLYFDLREGRNRDVGKYLRWKFGSDFITEAKGKGSVIAFSHLGRPYHAYTKEAMAWAYDALVRMDKDPSEGCIVVNYLISPSQLFKLHFCRKENRKRIRARLARLKETSDDFCKTYIYNEFNKVLSESGAFGLEVTKGYTNFFSALQPGVVFQADAVSKGTRQLSVCAKNAGGKVVYVADRICTDLRMSNQLIAESLEDLHLPDHYVVFDQITQDEFIRQGVRSDHIHAYHRGFSADRRTAVQAGPIPQIVFFLQDYQDNIGGMIWLGVEIVKRIPGVHVLYKEHPNFPICEKARASVTDQAPGRLHFLYNNDPIDYGSVLAMITGYSTATVPGILQGVPLIWLRRSVDNSIYGEAYLKRIGAPADTSEEVIDLLIRLMSGDQALNDFFAKAREESREIFITGIRGSHKLKDAMHSAWRGGFKDIRKESQATVKSRAILCET